MKKTNKSAVIVFVLLLLVAVTAMMVASTYAKYTAEVNGTGTVTVAKWAFTTDNPAANLNATVEFLDTVDPTSLVNGKVAPGTRGSFKINISNATSEVGAEVTLKFGTITGLPTNMKLYKDAACTIEVPTTGIVGKIAQGENLDFPIYWKWAYETTGGDAADTADGEAASTISIPLNITGIQTNPADHITTGIQ